MLESIHRVGNFRLIYYKRKSKKHVDVHLGIKAITPLSLECSRSRIQRIEYRSSLCFRECLRSANDPVATSLYHYQDVICCLVVIG